MSTSKIDPSAPFFAQPIAHRGLHDRTSGVIENTKAAFERAIEHGYAIECDLQLTGDGIPFVFHDETLDRLTGQKGPVSALSAGQMELVPIKDSALPTHPMRFSQLLEFVNGRVPLVVELKHQEDGRDDLLAHAAVVAAQSYSGALTFKSFSPPMIDAVRRAGFAGPRGIIVERMADGWGMENLSLLQRLTLRHLLHYPMTRFDYISCSHADLSLPAVALFRVMGKPVMTWTVKNQETADAVRKTAHQIVFEGFEPRRA